MNIYFFHININQKNNYYDYKIDWDNNRMNNIYSNKYNMNFYFNIIQFGAGAGAGTFSSNKLEK